MDFFAAQDRAKAHTRTLIVYFIFGVAGLVGLLYLVALIAVGAHGARYGHEFRGLWQPDVFFWVAIITLMIVGGGGVSKIMELQGGGPAVAGSLDARPVSPQTTDPAERRLLNVVEEMALAAGLPVPPVYVMDESGINACAAGLRQEDAVVIVTRGALTHLNRDELQGVIGHEFSHILNGDMRLNLQLVGAVFGLMAIAIIGKLMVRARDRRDGRIVALGFGIWAIGSLGVMFGRLIQAAVSRQRECLADASSVQFTRNPGGLANALKKIGGFSKSSHIDNAHAEETAHMYFAPGVNSFFATHPPLEQRIRELEPNWDGKFIPVKLNPEEMTEIKANFPTTPKTILPAQMFLPATVAAVFSLDDIRVWRDSLPAPITEALSTLAGCRALVLALALDTSPAQRPVQLEKLRNFGEPAAELAAALSLDLDQVQAGRKLPLLELALGGLVHTLDMDKNSLLARLRELTNFDRGQNLSQFALWRVAEYRLRPQPPRLGPPAPDYYRNDVSMVLSALAHLSTPDDAAAQPVFAQGFSALPIYTSPTLALTPRLRTTIAQIQTACLRLEGAPFALKKQLLEAGALIAQADGVVEPSEAELLRGLAASLGCAVPLN